MHKFILTIIISLIWSAVVFASEIEAVHDKNLSYILANFEIIAESNYPDSKGMAIKILKVQDHEECDGTPQSCPKSALFIVVSEYGEAPKQKVYQLPKKHNWSFVSWKLLPDEDGPNDYIVFELKAQTPSKELSSGWWVDELFTVNANYRRAEILKK